MNISVEDIIAIVFGCVGFIILIAILAFSKELRARKHMSEKLFFRMIVTTFVADFFSVDFFWLDRMDNLKLAAVLQAGSFIAVEIMSFLVVIEWFIFVDYMVYKSPDHLKRRFKFTIIPVIIAVLLSICQYGAIFSRRFSEETGMKIFSVCLGLVWIIQIIIIIQAYVIVRRFRKERQIPLFLNLEVFAVPAIFGYIITYISSYTVRIVGFAIGLAATWFVVSTRYKYLDAETGFYNRSFLKLANNKAGKRVFDVSTAIILKAPGNGKELAHIIKDGKPINAEIIKLENDVYIVTSRNQSVGAIRMYLKYLDKASAACVPFFKVDSYNINRADNETVQDFVNRVIDEGGDNNAMYKD